MAWWQVKIPGSHSVSLFEKVLRGKEVVVVGNHSTLGCSVHLVMGFSKPTHT